jgi:hypothetical protein
LRFGDDEGAAVRAVFGQFNLHMMLYSLHTEFDALAIRWEMGMENADVESNCQFLIKALQNMTVLLWAQGVQSGMSRC